MDSTEKKVLIGGAIIAGLAGVGATIALLAGGKPQPMRGPGGRLPATTLSPQMQGPMKTRRKALKGCGCGR